VIQVKGSPRPVVPAEVLARMTDAMTHRGPDDRGTYQADGVALGVRRLSIVDVEGGHQPFSDETESVWAVQNGELYNHVELREELRRDGHAFVSRCDTEVLPHLYQRDGADAPKQLRGKFAFAVWDGERRRAVIARDRMGIKPLYYADCGDRLVFASELKSLLASGLVSTQLDFRAIDAYLSFGYFAGTSTPLVGVSKLLPAHRLVVERGVVRVERYWELPHPDVDGRRRGVDPREYAEQLIRELDESVRLRLMSDVPLGAMLSGGLDSSVIVALMARNMSEPVQTFSVAFVEDRHGNELEDARLVAKAFGTEHHDLELSLREQAVPLDELVWHLDEPLADLSSLGFHALSKLAARHVTVALSGQGADELLGGYPTHRNAALAARWARLPGPVRSLGPGLAEHVPRRVRLAARAVASAEPVARFMIQSCKLDDELRRRLLRGPMVEVGNPPGADLVAGFLDGYEGDPFAAGLFLHQQLGLVDDMLHYFDRASMANSLEVRVPFLDHHVVEFCATVPNSLKVKGLTGKFLLRLAARDLIPSRIVEKRKVGFFSHAVADWFRAQADGVIADYLLRPSPAYAEFLDRDAVTELVRHHDSAGERSLLLAILMLEVWLSDYLPRALHDVSSPRSADRARA
jgi:asparagine synthase (glutamine-hydrolysing)